MSDEFRLGPWLVQPSQNTISNHGNTTRLEPKMVEVLVCLTESPGETVSKEQLIRKVWGEYLFRRDRVAEPVKLCRQHRDPPLQNAQGRDTLSTHGAQRHHQRVATRPRRSVEQNEA